jgi:hypothetical protein
MVYLLLSLIVLGLFCAFLGYRSHKRGESEEIVVGEGDCTRCTPDNVMCEQECMLKAATEPVEYFDDEELDVYKGRASNSYNEEETTQFAEVLETLRPEEVKSWNRSLILRGINMPDGIKDEYISLTDS